MNILVTGSQGYIGSWLAPLLAERGHHVTGLDTGFYQSPAWYDPGFSKQVLTICQDVRRIQISFLQLFDVVVHLAELSNDPLGQLLTEATMKINYQGSTSLASKCRAAGIKRFIYSSSCSVYGTGEGGTLKTEDSLVNPQTTYASCKFLVEKELAALADHTFSPVILRNATAFGRSPAMRFDLVLNNLAGLAWTTGEVRMSSDGSPWRPLVHVKDICRAMILAIEAPALTVHNQIFNVGSNTANHQVKEIAATVAEEISGCRVAFGKLDGDTRSYRVAFDKLTAAFPDFGCAYTARDGARELLETFASNRTTLQEFNQRAYNRLQQIQYLREKGQLNEDLFWNDGMEQITVLNTP